MGVGGAATFFYVRHQQQQQQQQHRLVHSMIAGGGGGTDDFAALDRHRALKHGAVASRGAVCVLRWPSGVWRM